MADLSTFKVVELIAPETLMVVTKKRLSLQYYEVRIKISYCGICGSDMKGFINPRKHQVLGHEVSGQIIETSEKSSEKFSIGDRVTVFPMVACLKCNECAVNNFRDCKDKKSIGYDLPGAYSEELVIDSRFVIKLEDEISLEQGALLEPLCCGQRLMREIENDCDYSKDIHIVIIGDGPIATADYLTLNSAGYFNITLIGKHSFRMELAKRYGALRVVSYLDIHKVLQSVPEVDVCIMAAPADNTAITVVDFMKRQSYFYPQTRIQNKNLNDKITSGNINIGRAFTYYIEDFHDSMMFILQNKINTDAFNVSVIDLLDVPDYYNNKTRVHKENMKVLIKNENFFSER